MRAACHLSQLKRNLKVGLENSQKMRIPLTLGCIHLLAIIILLLVTSTTCRCPSNVQHSHRIYTTDDATILTHVAHIVELEIHCDHHQNTPQEAEDSFEAIYALLDRTVLTAARIDSNRFQVSWVKPLEEVTPGPMVLKVYDEEGHAGLKRAQRLGESLDQVEALFSLEVIQRPLYGGQWISCELLAVLFSLLVAYYAVHFRAKLLS